MAGYTWTGLLPSARDTRGAAAARQDREDAWGLAGVGDHHWKPVGWPGWSHPWPRRCWRLRRL